MACSVKISGRGRYKLTVGLLTLITLQAIIALCLIACALHILANVNTRLHPSDKVFMDQIFASLVVYGTVLFLVEFTGLKICHNCLKQHLNPSCGYLLRLWAVLSFVLSILGLALAILAPQCEKMMMQHLRNSLHRGMGQYLHDPKWKTVLDLLQQSYDCCGSEHYTDWYRTAWLHSDQLREDTQTVLRYTEIDGRVLPPIVPWSCCDPMVKLPCLHDQLQQMRSRFVWQDQPELVLETIHTEGCLLQLRPPVQRGLDSVSGVLSLAFILQMAVMIIARFLYTSSRNALLQGDPDSAAWGWLWGRGDLGLALGKTLPQLDKIKEEKKAAKTTMAATLDEMKNGTKPKEKDDAQSYEQSSNESEEKKKKKKKKRFKRPFHSSNVVPEEEGEQLLPNEENK